MSLIKRRTSGLFPTLRTSFPDLFDMDSFLETPSTRREVIPSVNIRENEDSFNIEVAAPGLTKSDFHVFIENGVLTISSEKKTEKKDRDENYTYREFSYNTFKRSFSLPEIIEDSKVKAQYEDGILKITLQKNPKLIKEKVKEIAIS